MMLFTLAGQCIAKIQPGVADVAQAIFGVTLQTAAKQTYP